MVYDVCTVFNASLTEGWQSIEPIRPFHGMLLQGFHHQKLAGPHCFAVQTREM
jgi:hypothetical protein